MLTTLLRAFSNRIRSTVSDYWNTTTLTRTSPTTAMAFHTETRNIKSNDLRCWSEVPVCAWTWQWWSFLNPPGWVRATWASCSTRAFPRLGRLPSPNHKRIWWKKIQRGMKRRGDAYFVGSTAAVSVAQSRADGQGASRFLPHLLLDFLLSPGFRCLRWGKK